MSCPVHGPYIGQTCMKCVEVASGLAKMRPACGEWVLLDKTATAPTLPIDYVELKWKYDNAITCGPLKGEISWGMIEAYRLPLPKPFAEPAPQGVDAVLAERGARYGTFIEHAEITQGLKSQIRRFLKERNKILSNDQQEALDMICHKIGRIINGDPDYADSWVDIAGYAKLVADRLQGVIK